MMRGILGTTLINLIVMGALLLTLELGYRTISFADSCLSATCDATYWRLGSKFRKNVYLGMIRDDPVLGQVPNDGDYEVPWLDPAPIRVTIRDSVRLNGTGSDTVFEGDHVTLAVGDSFTFGDEVSDSDTWPSCLERKWNTRVVNAGVPGYGAAQAVLRAQSLERRIEFDRVIWSILSVTTSNATSSCRVAPRVPPSSRARGDCDSPHWMSHGTYWSRLLKTASPGTHTCSAICISRSSSGRIRRPTCCPPARSTTDGGLYHIRRQPLDRS